MNKTIFIAAVFAAATLLAAGLIVFPGSVQEAQANPCSTEASAVNDVDTEYNCDFRIGSLEIEEEVEPCTSPTDLEAPPVTTEQEN
jgi:hypothetical protein